MKRVLFKIIIPAAVLALWMLICSYPCDKPEGFDYFLYWIMVGFPYGMKKMCVFLIPKNYDIAGSLGILTLNGIVGGLIGGFVVIVRIIQILAEIVRMFIGSKTRNMEQNI